MVPQVKYARTEDKFDIAFWTLGDGATLIYLPEPLTTPVQSYSQTPAVRGFLDRMARSFRVVRFDHRGSGLSSRNAESFTIEALSLDIAAVIEALEAHDVTLLAEADSGPIAISFAVQHPDTIANLLLWNTWARSQDVTDHESWKVLDDLAAVNYQLYLETIYGALMADTGLDAREVSKHLMTSVASETYRKAQLATWTYDVRDVLSQVTCPTLVMHRDNILLSREVSSGLAATIPGSRAIVLAAPGGLPWMGDVDAVAEAIEAFLLPEGPSRHRDGPAAFRTVLFTDLVGHTVMMQRLGDEAGRDVLREHERITREVLKANGGTEVKTMGDGFMASFGSVTKAVECAVALQRAFAGHEGESLNVRVGLNAGEPIEEDGDLFGATVILASRIAAKAGGGEILVADTVRGLCSGKGFLFADRGEFVAKGFEEPVRISEVNWRS